MFKKIKEILVPNEFNRHNWVKDKLSSLESGKKILDAGCGTQRYRKHCSHLQYFGQDFGEYKGDGEGLQCEDWRYGKLDYVGDIWDIKEKDETFDAILCTEVIEHIPYPNETVNEFSRLLKQGGVLMLTAPYASLPHMQPYYYYSGFSKEWYIYNLEKNGFEIVEITPNGDFFTFLIQENLRGIKVVKNPLLKILYTICLLPKIPLDFALSKVNKDYQLVLGYHVVAKKK